MLPQHGGVPNFNLRISGPFLLVLALILITGSMLTLSFYLNADPGDLTAQTRVRLSLAITLLLSVFVLLAGTGRWWHPHLWKNRRRKHHSHHRKHRSH
ncbi:MAG: hypothetical protein HOO88_03655 [Kiritimatiellaceae bacterium]|nr:hypothetical protein [Kiritimatiellaceae bacterium]